MATRSSLRASDADRERVADRLRDAAAEGRLLTHELEERLVSALRARTYGELDALVRDLPRERRPVQRHGSLQRRGAKFLLQRPMLLIAVVLVAGVLACVLAAAAVAFSGIWLAVAILTLAFRSRHGAWRPPGRHGAADWRR